uniref:Uncharacterized protein n=1 Tax=uncultured organism TaxID=155900 RepID=A0A7L9QCM6_9ZZZZ|nr:hypothetical protein [uncultured organism]
MTQQVSPIGALLTQADTHNAAAYAEDVASEAEHFAHIDQRDYSVAVAAVLAQLEVARAYAMTKQPPQPSPAEQQAISRILRA